VGQETLQCAAQQRGALEILECIDSNRQRHDGFLQYAIFRLCIVMIARPSERTRYVQHFAIGLLSAITCASGLQSIPCSSTPLLHVPMSINFSIAQLLCLSIRHSKYSNSTHRSRTQNRVLSYPTARRCCFSTSIALSPYRDLDLEIPRLHEPVIRRFPLCSLQVRSEGKVKVAHQHGD
jgi:hypothetical protein